MKRILTLLLVCASLNLLAQQYQFEQKDVEGFMLESQTRDAISINYHINGFSLVDSPEPNVNAKNITISGVFLHNTPGAPDLPSQSTYVAIPNGSTIEMEICHINKEVFHNVELAPAAELLPDNSVEHPRVIKDTKIYSKDAFYPENPIVLNGVSDIRKVNVARIGIMPFQYNPVTKELVVYHDIEIKLHIQGGDDHFGNDRYRTPEWDNILEDLLLNPEVLQPIDRGERLRKHYENRETGCEYLIVTPDNDEYVNLAERIREFRIKQGVPTEIMNINQCGGNNCIEFNNYLQNAYETWDMPPAALLLIGDHLSDGSKGILSYRLDNHYEYNPYWSDVPYGDMNGDYILDLAIGRISMESETQLETIISKDINYETNPPTDFNYYDEPFTAAGYQHDLWTLMTGEIINGFWEKELGKHPKHLNAIVHEDIYPHPEYDWSDRANTNDIVSYFGPQGLNYIPNNLTHLTDYSTDEQRIADAINSGAFISQYRDHGTASGWYYPPFQIRDLSKLHNDNLTYMMSNGCNIGKIAEVPCFIEQAMRERQRALGMLATVNVSYGVVQDIYLYGFYDHLWSNFMPDYGTDHPYNFLLPAFANVAANYYFESSSYVGDDFKEFSHCLFHHYGDVYMNLYSEVPREIEVNSDLGIYANSTLFNITTEEGTTICLTVGNEIIGYGIGTGQPQQIEIIPQSDSEVLVTLKKQNCYRREISLTPLIEGVADLRATAFGISDPIGDNDHHADNDEECFIDITIKNLGLGDASAGTAVLTCTDSLVTIINGTCSFPALSYNEECSIDQAFSVYFAASIKDGTIVPFKLRLETGDAAFELQQDIIVNAPQLEFSNATLTNLSGDTILSIPSYGQARLSFDLINTGGQDMYNITSQVMAFKNLIEIDSIESISHIGAHECHHIVTLIDADATPFDQAFMPFEIFSAHTYGYVQVDTIIPYGNVSEDFETEEMNPIFQWNQNTQNQWYRDNSDAYSGDFSFRSAYNLPSGKISRVVCQITMEEPGTVSFYYKTSAKDNDRMKIISSNATISCSGMTEWQRGTIQLEEGQNQILIQFSKREGEPAGDDCARIDLVQLPPKARILISAGENLTSCLDEDVVPNSKAYFHENIAWSTEGDGYFNDSTLVCPIYTPGENDKANLRVDLTMTATAEGMEEAVDRVSINFIEDISEHKPDQPIGDTLVDLLHNQQSTYQSDATNIFTWAIEPNEAGNITPEGTQATINWNENFIGIATLTYQIHNGCSISDYSSPIRIKVINSFEIEENANTKIEVYPNPATDELFVRLNGIDDTEVTLQLTDIYSRTVCQSKASSENGNIDTRLTVRHLIPGLYNLQVIANSCICNRTIIVK